MGFRCNLRNDRFTLRGVEEFDGKDYLVVGSVMPPRVNVISHNQTISFSQMIRRLERAMGTTDGQKGVIVGVVISGWLKGHALEGEWTVIPPSYPAGAGVGNSFAVTLKIKKGVND
jgi:hypothetical protein